MTLPAVRSASAPDRRDPFREFEDLYRQLDRWLDLVAAAVHDGGRAWSPGADVRETDEAYLVEVELPGVKRGDIEVYLAGSELAVKGELKQRWWQGLFRRRSHRSGRFACRVTLPDEVNGDDIRATLAKGVLTVRLPKTDVAKRRRIAIKTA